MIKIIKPKFDTRQMVAGKLKNNIKYALVCDDNIDNTYISIVVKVGTFYDPKDYNGLAHFLEHMLFMGSKKYPNNKYYFNRLNEHNGNSNAYTFGTTTMYYFNVHNDGVLEMIDIFSQFFIDPLFDQDSINQEINIINNEHINNIDNYRWQREQLLLDLTDENSVTNNFGTGSLKTLKHDDIREKMIDFYKKYYTTDNISICIVSSFSIKKQLAILKNTFEIIPITQSVPFEITKPFYTKNNGKFYHMKTIATIYEIIYIWELPLSINFVHDKEILLFIYIFQFSEKGLAFHLKSIGYIENIDVAYIHTGSFIITITLTKLGTEHLNYIESALLNYMKKIAKLDIKQYALYFQKILKLGFDILKLDSFNIAYTLSSHHHYYDSKNIYYGCYLINNIFETSHYQNIYNKYIITKQFIKIICCPSIKIKIKSKQYFKINEYNAKYTELYKSTNNIVSKKINCMKIDNLFFNCDLKIIQTLDQYNIPTMIAPNIFYSGSSKFNEPFVYILLHFNNSTYFESPKNCMLTRIVCNILDFIITSIVSKYQLVDCNVFVYSLYSTSSISINIKVLNYTTIFGLFLKKLYMILSHIDIFYDKLSKKYIDSIIVNYKEMLEPPKIIYGWSYTDAYVNSKVYSTNFSDNMLYNSMKEIRPKHIKQYINKLFKSSSLITYVCGNIDKINVVKQLVKFNRLLGNKLSSNIFVPTIKLIKNKLIKTKKTNTNCVTYYYPIGFYDYKIIVLTYLFRNIINQEFYNELRTTYQMGYMVRMNIIHTNNYYYIEQRIQSSKKVNIIEKRIKIFNKRILNIVMKANFNKYIDMIKNMFDDKINSIHDIFTKYSDEITNNTFVFNRTKLLLDQINNITKNDLILFVKEKIIPENIIKVIIQNDN